MTTNWPFQSCDKSSFTSCESRAGQGFSLTSDPYCQAGQQGRKNLFNLYSLPIPEDEIARHHLRRGPVVWLSFYGELKKRKDLKLSSLGVTCHSFCGGGGGGGEGSNNRFSRDGVERRIRCGTAKSDCGGHSSPALCGKVQAWSVEHKTWKLQNARLGLTVCLQAVWRLIWGVTELWSTHRRSAASCQLGSPKVVSGSTEYESIKTSRQSMIPPVSICSTDINAVSLFSTTPRGYPLA